MQIRTSVASINTAYRQRKSDHLDHQETSEGECSEHHDHDPSSTCDQACGSGQPFQDRVRFAQPAHGFKNPRPIRNTS